LTQAQVSTIRTKLLKIGAQVRVTVRKVWVSMASSYPAKCPGSGRRVSMGISARCTSLQAL